MSIYLGPLIDVGKQRPYWWMEESDYNSLLKGYCKLCLKPVEDEGHRLITFENDQGDKQHVIKECNNEPRT